MANYLPNEEGLGEKVYTEGHLLPRNRSEYLRYAFSHFNLSPSSSLGSRIDIYLLVLCNKVDCDYIHICVLKRKPRRENAEVQKCSHAKIENIL